MSVKPLLNVPQVFSSHFNQEAELFDIFKAYKKIGSCALVIVENQKSPRSGQQFFPDSWFWAKNSDRVFPILEVTGLETFQQKGVGNGRLSLQALYELSKNKGCGGRMLVYADFDSAGFYEHCGFKGGEKGKNGFKYFDPTSENLTLLFPNGFQSGGYMFIPVELQKTEKRKLSQTDKALFERMLQKEHS